MNNNLYQNISGDILLVDDQYDNLKVLGEILESVGYKTRKAINGETAILAANYQPPDLILLDIMMPDMDGYAVCQQFKNNPFTADIPIIFLTALDEVFNKVKAFKMGGSDYIVKPFQVEEVVARIKNQIMIKKQQDLLQKENEKLRQAETKLSQSRALLASILTTSLDGIAALQAVRSSQGEIEDFYCLVVNPILAQKLGKTPEYFTGKIYLKKFINKLNSELFKDLVQVVETGKRLKSAFVYQEQKEKHWYDITAVKLKDGLAITIHDITKIKQVESALKQSNQKLERIANLDGLTQIPNRRYFEKKFEKLWQDCQGKNQPISLIILDIDYFKQYNDSYGHLAGDDCLYKVAQTIETIVNSTNGIVARYGGEEFVVILPETNQKLAIKIAEQIRIAVKNLQILHQKSTVSSYVTISLGLVTEIPHTSPKNLLCLADKALYLAKTQGRDRLSSI